MEVIGHRGCAGQVPENTVGALVRAARELDGVELDVRRCESGELVVFHDETVDRVTEAAGAVADLPWATLRELDVLGSGESIPRLSTAVAALPDGVPVQVELKERGLAADVRDLVADRDVHVRITSFDPAVLAAVRDLDWEAPRGLLFEGDPEANLATARELGCTAVNPHYDCCLETDVVAAAHRDGMRVVAWKAVETRAEVDALRAVGVDAVTTDRLDVVPARTEQVAGSGSEPVG